MQTPKSILLHLDSSARTAERIKVAGELAEAFEAEVTGQPCTLSALVRYPFAMEAAGEAVAIMQEIDKGRATGCTPPSWRTARACGACAGPSRRATAPWDSPGARSMPT